jgi:hypothetical protein
MIVNTEMIQQIDESSTDMQKSANIKHDFFLSTMRKKSKYCAKYFYF